MIGNFFIGIGPVIAGLLAIYFSALKLLPETFCFPFDELHPWVSLKLSAANLFSAENLIKWQFWLFVYIFFSVAGCMRLSLADIKGAAAGFFAIALCLLLFNLL